MTPDEIKAELPEYAWVFDFEYVAQAEIETILSNVEELAEAFAKARKKNRIAEEVINLSKQALTKRRSHDLLCDYFKSDISLCTCGLDETEEALAALKQMQEVDG